MKYLLGGYYGMQNIGDDVLLYVTLAEVRRLDPAAAFSVFSHVPLFTPFPVHVVAPNSRRLNGLRQLLKNDVWLFGGGGLLQDRSDRSLETLENLARWVSFAKWIGKRVAMVGIGVGPLVTARGRTASRRLIEAADYITVRDTESAELTAQIAPSRPIAVTADLAFLLSSGLTPPEPKGYTLGVSLLNLRHPHGTSGPEDEFAATAAAALNAFLERNPAWRIQFFEFFSGSTAQGDASILRAVKARVHRAGQVAYYPYNRNCMAVLNEIGKCSAFVGMRFHSCVLSYLARIPFLMIDYHHKCSSLARRIGLPAEAVAHVNLLHDAEGLAHRLQMLVDRPTSIAAAVPPRVMMEHSQRNFTAFSEWLRGRAAIDTCCSRGAA